LFEEHAVAIQTDAGEVIDASDRPRESFAGHERTTPWTELQLLYFIGYAFWNYFTTPFLLASNGVSVAEVEPWSENGETWRVLQATFPKNLDTHCAVQQFYFSEDGLLRRQELTKVTGEIVSKAKGFVSSTLHRRTDGSKVTIAIDIFFAPVRNCGKVFAVSECD
jgi:hypothetical protein